MVCELALVVAALFAGAAIVINYKTRTRPWALAGGGQGEKNEVVIQRGTPDERVGRRASLAERPDHEPGGDCARQILGGAGALGQTRTGTPCGGGF